MMYSNHRKDHKGGGAAILVHDSINHRRRKDLELMIEKEAESTYIKITMKNGQNVIAGSLYRAPNTNEHKPKAHIEEVNCIIKRELGDKNLLLRMDHNLDLLKCHEHMKTQQSLIKCWILD